MGQLYSRERLLNKLTNPEILWDVLVIGGGATGLGVALDAISRGYKTLLVEQADFAKGTSSRSTKLVHGGVRYLAQGDVKLVREACVERGLLQKNAPHLVKNQTFIIPIYNFWDSVKYTLGLKMYDWIAGKLSLGRSVFISKKDTITVLPGVRTKGLRGGVLYHDGQFDDSRLALNLAQSIIEQGGVALNYVKVTGLIKDSIGKICGAYLLNTESNETYQIKSKAVVNATGVFVDGILKMDDPAAREMVIASQGIHLVVDKRFFPSEHALMIPETSDGRVLFAVPWHKEVVLGTTDTPVGKPSMEPVALEKEISFILDTASKYLAEPVKRKDVLSVFAGLRPLAAPKHETSKTKEISRSHKIVISSSNLFTIIGGKWTTFRKMGEDMVDAIEKRLGWKHNQTLTEQQRIHGYIEKTDWEDPFYFYGDDKTILKERIGKSEHNWLSEGLKIHAEQVIWAVQNELARTVEDMLARRTRALFLDAKESIRICEQVATIMATELGKNNDWKEQQISDYKNLAQQYILQ